MGVPARTAVRQRRARRRAEPGHAAHAVRAPRGDGRAPGDRRRCHPSATRALLPIATQNPFETAGTFPLVEGQLDRFTLVTEIGPPDATTERELLLGTGGESALDVLEPLTDPTELTAAIAAVRSVYCAREVADYAVAISNATRCTATAIGAARALCSRSSTPRRRTRCSKRRTYVVPDDISRSAVPVLAHRLVLRDPGRLSDQRTLVQTVLDAVPAPRP